MEPINFPQVNITFTKPVGWTDEECGPLPSYRSEEENLSVSLWKPTWKERFSILFFGKVWLGVIGNSQPPVWIWGTKEYFVKRNINE